MELLRLQWSEVLRQDTPIDRQQSPSKEPAGVEETVRRTD
jgi:hypothetical protein